MKKFLLVIAGPTASGKTDLSISLAKHFKTEIISADSRQFFRELTIGTAKPSGAQLKEAKHHFINSLSIHDDYNAGKFEYDCLQLLDKLFLKHNLVILCGGSGLYLNAILKGIDKLPGADKDLRKLFAEKPVEELQRQLQHLDPKHYHEIDTKNRHRLIRALEVCILTGKKYSDLRKNKPADRNFIPILIGLDVNRELLYKRINERVNDMMENGLADEVKKLLPYKNMQALQTVGYKEFFKYDDGELNMQECAEMIKQNTRNYAKRQLTWFRKMKGIQWFSPRETELIRRYIADFIKK